MEVLEPVGGGSGLEMANKLYKAQGNPIHGEIKVKWNTIEFDTQKTCAQHNHSRGSEGNRHVHARQF